MWQLSTPVGELILRSLCVFTFIFIVFRMWGKKHFGQLTPFDLALLVIISETTQNALIGEDMSVFGCFIAILTLVILNVILDKLSFHFRFFEKLIDGVDTVLVRQGRLDRQGLRREGITINELMEAIREEGVLSISEVERATLESNGHISVVKKEVKK